jgi:aspartate kinase
VNIIAIAQGSSELTIAIVVSRDGLEKAVRAVHAECGMGG